MSTYATHLPNGTSSNTSIDRLLGRYLSGSGVIEPTAFTVSAQGSPNMTVKVSGSTTDDNLIVRTTSGDVYHGWSTANESVTISSNATGVTKKDHIVAFINIALTSGTADNPGGLQLTAVRGTGTAAPTDAEIDSGTGHKPWIRLAEVTVGNGVSSINSGNIVDLRGFARLAGSKLDSGSVDATKLSTGAIYLGHASKITNATTTSATPVAVAGLSLTVTVPIGGRNVKLTFTANSVYGTVASFITVSIWDGTVGSGTQVGSFTANPTSAGQQLTANGSVIVSPGAGSKTYNVGLQTSAGTATLVGGSTTPAQLIAELT